MKKGCIISLMLCWMLSLSAQFLHLGDTISIISPSSATVVYHKVRKGETFNSIASHYGVSVANLKRWNGKSRKSTLKVGSRLKIYLPTPKT